MNQLSRMALSRHSFLIAHPPFMTRLSMKPALKISVLATALTLSFAALADETAPLLPTAGDTSASSLSSAAARTDASSSSLAWTGVGEVAAESTATTNTLQSTSDNVSASSSNSPNTARMESGAAEGATGNIGVNIAAGAGNLQGNSASIVSSAANDVFASANTFVQQNTMTNFGINLENSPNEAFLDAALAGASGNIGVNIAAGSGNAQSNQLSMIETGSNRVARAAAAINQSASGNNSDSASSFTISDSANRAVMASGALAMAGGNIGVNIAAGVGNAQANALSVAVVAR
jgi:hypothetical protein